MTKNDSTVPSFEMLFDMEKIQEIQDSFAAATGVASIITDTQGRPITRPSNFCRLCKDIIRKSEKGLANCIQSDAVIGCYNPDGQAIHTCLSGGLWKACANINIAKKHVANWLVGQVRNEKTDIKKMMEYAELIGVDQDKFAKAVDEVTVMSLDQFKAICTSLFLITNHLSEQAYQRIKQSQTIFELKLSESRLSNYKIKLEATVEKRTYELKASNDALIKTQTTLEKKIELRTNELKQKNEYLSALHETSLGMFTRLDVSQVLESIVKRASNLTRIPDGAILIYDPGENVVEIKAGWGKYSQLKGTKLASGEGVSGTTWENGEHIVVNDYPNWPEKSKNHLFDFVTSIAVVPLTSGSKIEGIMGLSHHMPGKIINPEIIRILEQFAELATIAIDNSKLFESMKEELDKRIRLENEQKQMESKLRQSQRLESIGTLAGGIAHDFNNILFPILGFSEMIMHDLPDKSPIKNQLQPIIDSTLRAKDLVQQILTFSRETEKDYKPLKIQLLIQEVLKLVRASLPSTIKIIKNIPKEIGMIMADPTQIHQILMNLITNASHSMEENGGGTFCHS